MKCLLLAFVWAAAAGLRGQQQVPANRPAGWPCAGGGRAVDPTHAAVAESTGGHLYMLGPSEIARSTPLLVWQQKHHETLFRAVGEMREGKREFSFPVDSTVESLMVTVSLQCKDSVSILEPSGVESPGERVDYRAGRGLRVLRPTPGVWKLRLAGRGLFFVTAEAASELSLDQARFVEPGGRPGHEGLFPVKKPPAMGSSALLQIEMAGAPRDLRVRLAASDSTTLDRPEIVEPNLVRVTVRHSAFRVVVEGTDERGWPFERMAGPLTSIH